MKKSLIMALITVHVVTAATGASAQVPAMGGKPAAPEASVVLAKSKNRKAPAYRRAEPRPGDRLIGRVPPNRAQQRADDGAALAILGMGIGAATGGRGRSGGFGGVPLASGGRCQADYANPNPVGCGGNIPNPRGDNGLRGPSKCPGKNGTLTTTNTFRSGCSMASMDQPGSRAGDILNRSLGGR